MVIIAPVVQLAVRGYAATTDVKDIPIAIVDADRPTASREPMHRFESSANFKIVAMPGSTAEIDRYLDRGEAWMASSIPPDYYGRKVASGRPTTIQVVADDTDSNSTGVAMGYALRRDRHIGVVLVLVVSIYWFEVPMRGSIALLFAMCMIYLLTTLGLGLFVPTVSRTQQQAMMTAIFFFLTPRLYLSGFVFPIENMPAWIQPLTCLIPLRYFLVIVRGIFQKGIGLDILWPQALALFAWGAIVLTLATLRWSKRLG